MVDIPWLERDVYFQAHNLEERIHDIDLEALDVKTVSEVCACRRTVYYVPALR